MLFMYTDGVGWMEWTEKRRAGKQFFYNINDMVGYVMTKRLGGIFFRGHEIERWLESGKEREVEEVR